MLLKLLKMTNNYIQEKLINTKWFVKYKWIKTCSEIISLTSKNSVQELVTKSISKIVVRC